MKISLRIPEMQAENRTPFFFTTAPRPSFLSKCYRGALSLAREADHSLQSSTEVKIRWNYTSIAPYVLCDGVLLSIGIFVPSF